jgi:hypothetical protein
LYPKLAIAASKERSYKVRYIVIVLGAKPIWDLCNREKVLNFSEGGNLNGGAKICMHPTFLMAWQSGAVLQLDFAVQVVPYIIEDEITQHMGGRKTLVQSCK